MDESNTSIGLRLAGFVGLFVGLAALGLWWVAPPPDLLAEAWTHFTEQSHWTWFWLGFLAVAVIAADAFRLIVFGRLMDVDVGVFAAFEATIADNFFSWLTPGSALGEPAATYMLSRHGIDVGSSLTIAYARFTTSFAFIFTLVAVLLAVGFGPPLPGYAVATLSAAVGFAGLFMAALTTGALLNEHALALIDSIEQWALGDRDAGRAHNWISVGADTLRDSIERLEGLKDAGIPGVFAMLLVHAVYYAAFIGVIAVLAMAYQVDFRLETIPRALIYLGFIYLMPTPGGTGAAEGSADVFFEQLLPMGAPFVVVVLFRSATFYLHVLIGFVYLPIRGALAPVLRGGEEAD